MKRLREASLHSVPVSLLLFCWVTMGAGVSYDHLFFASYGFPLQWYSPSIVVTGGVDVAIGKMLVDALIYWLLAILPVLWLRRRTAVPRHVAGGLTLGLWIASLACAGFSLVSLLEAPHSTFWSLNPGVPKSVGRQYFLSVGIVPRHVKSF